MSEKELLYIDDTLGHLSNIDAFLTNYTVSVEDENFRKVLEDFDKDVKSIYKKFYKLIEKEEG